MNEVTRTQSCDAPETPRLARRQAVTKTEAGSSLRRAKKAALCWATVGILVGTLAGAALGVIVMHKRQRAREVVVSINGVVIDQTSFYRSLEGTSGAQVIRRMVGEELQLQFARKMGVAPSDGEVEAKLVQATQKPNFNKTLLENGEAMQDMRRNIRVNLARNNVLTQGITVSDADIRAFYNINVNPKNPKALFYTPERVTLQAIINVDAAQIKRAERDLQQGVAFATVAKNYGTGDGKQNSGLLSVSRRSQSGTDGQTEAENAFFGMKIGAQLGPRKFNKAWWIVRCLDKQAAQTQPLAQVMDECRTGALLTKGVPINAKKVEEEFTAFQQTANVQAFWKQYSAAADVK